MDKYFIPEAVLFDIDGTLLNTTEVYYRIAEESWVKVGLPPPDRKLLKRIMASGKPFWKYWNDLVPEEFRDNEAMKAQVKQVEQVIWKDMFLREAELIDGAREVIQLLYGLGCKLGLVTTDWGEEKYIPFRRAGVPVDKYFSSVITRQEVTKLKPSPEPIEICLKKLGVFPNMAVYVGDAPIDIQAGNAAGVLTVGVLTGVGTRKSLELQQPVMILDSVADLTSVMYSWMKKARRLQLSEGFYRCFRGLSKKFNNFAERFQINPAQLAAIQKLRVKDGLTVSELAEEMMLHINTSSELISRMEKEGLVRKEKSDEDKRVTKIYLTENGRQILLGLTSFSKEIEGFLEQHLSSQEMIIQSQNLQKLAKLF